MSNKATEPQTAKIDSKAVFAALDKVMAESLSTTKQEPGEPSRPAAKAEPEVRPSAPTSEEPLTPETAGSRPILRVVNAKLPPDAFVPENPATAQSAPVVAEPQQPDLTPFIAEDEPFRTSLENASRTQRALWIAVAVLFVIALTESIFLLVGSNRRRPPVAAAAPLATSLTVDSTPAGASITINGQGRGNTPSTLTVEPGDYQLTLTSGATTRSLPLVVRAGVNRQHVFFAEPESKAASATPADSGRSATAASSIPATATSNAVGGYLTVSSPIDVQLFERDALMGTSKSDRIMLPVGRHVLRTVNESYGYEGSMTVQVTAGSVSRVKLEMPDGVVNVNAVPWAEVTIDGKRFGPTPLGNVSLPIGSHEIVFTHPQLGERRQTAIVTLNGTNRVSVNLNQR